MKKVLSIDGGGIRGLIPARVLSSTEQRLATPLYDVFDLVAGTSTGGILASAIGVGMSARLFPSLYLDNAEVIFNRPFSWKVKTGWGLLGPKYPSDGLWDVLDSQMPGDYASDSLTKVMVTAYDGKTGGFEVLKSWRSEWTGWSAREFAYVTAAAPTFFPPYASNYSAWVDGGVGASNPTICALVEAQRLWPEEELTLVSLGTGVHEDPVGVSKGWGLKEWAPVIHEVLLDAQTDVVDYQLEHLRAQRLTSFRLQVRLPRDILMDATKEKDLSDLSDLGFEVGETVEFDDMITAITEE